MRKAFFDNYARDLHLHAVIMHRTITQTMRCRLDAIANDEANTYLEDFRPKQCAREL